jgi:hypothetical protein
MSKDGDNPQDSLRPLIEAVKIKCKDHFGEAKGIIIGGAIVGIALGILEYMQLSHDKKRRQQTEGVIKKAEPEDSSDSTSQHRQDGEEKEVPEDGKL